MRDPRIFTQGDPFDDPPPIDRSPEITEDQIDHAMDLVVATQNGSVDLIQERLRVSYLKATRIMDILEIIGVVGPEIRPHQRRYDHHRTRVVNGRSRAAIGAATASLQRRFREEAEREAEAQRRPPEKIREERDHDPQSSR